MKRRQILLQAVLGFSLVFRLTPAVADVETSFIARTKVALCPEFKLGIIAFEMAYSIGNDPTLIAADIVAQSYDAATNSMTVDLRFPSTFGTVPFHISSTCRNAIGFSPPSNIASISNCDALAKLDSDGDGLSNNIEDRNCDNFYSPGDYSNPDNVDTDGDGARDFVELLTQTNPSNPGDSHRPFVYSSAVYDPDGDGNSNPVVWRKSSGEWYVRDFSTPGNHLVFPFGKAGDIPFTYIPAGAAANVGIIRLVGLNYLWLFNGPGLKKSDGSSLNSLQFGIFGDNVVLGAWETPGVTNPAVARLFNNQWSFDIYLSNGTVRQVNWGGNGDIPKPQDFDGDGLLDFAVYRPSEQKLFILFSQSGLTRTIAFGTGTAEHTVRGDYTGDGIEDITFWEPLTGVFFSAISDNDFDPLNFFELSLGQYFTHLPLNWNRQNGKLLYTVIDHANGLRLVHPENDPNTPVQSLQWGLPGDSQG